MESSNQATWKRVLKCGISLGVFAASTTWRFFPRLLGRTPRANCVVLYYHSVPAEQRTKFAEQLDAIVRHAMPVALNAQTSFVPGEHYVAITFDDAFQNFADEALPELEKRRLPSTVFVIAEALNKAFGPAGSTERVMSLEQLRALPRELVTLGSHTLTHPMLTRVAEQDARREIALSKATLEAMLDSRIVLFSFPFGDFNERLVELCREAGYRHVVTTLPTFANFNEFVVGRVRVDPTDWLLEFRLKLAGAYRWLPLAFGLKSGVRRLFRAVLRARRENLDVPKSVIHESSGR